MDLPPLPIDSAPQNNPPEPPAPPAPSDTSGTAAPPDTPPVITSTPRKKFGGGRIIATILGILLLVGGVGAGIFLTQQKQLFQQKAQVVNPPYVGPVPDVVCTDQNTCIDASGNNTATGTTVVEGCVVETIGSDGVTHTARGTLANCGSTAGGGGGGQATGCYPAAQPGVRGISQVWLSDLTATDVTVNFSFTSGNDATRRGATVFTYSTNPNFSGATPRAWGGTIVDNIHENCTPSSSDGCIKVPITPNTNYYFKVETTYDDNEVSYSCGAKTVSLTTNNPTPTPPAPQCISVKAYSSTWTVLTAADLAALSAGDSVNFCVTGANGTFDQAQFKINTTTENPTTTKGQGAAASDFCQTYKILSTDTTINVQAKVHDATSSAWVGEAF